MDGARGSRPRLPLSQLSTRGRAPHEQTRAMGRGVVGAGSDLAQFGQIYPVWTEVFSISPAISFLIPDYPR